MSAPHICPSCGRQLASSVRFCPLDGTPLRAEGEPAADLAPGTTVGEYEIVSRLAEGGTGSIYSAVQPGIGRKVAIRVLSPPSPVEASRVDSFIAEARTVHRIGHPNLVDVFSFGRLPDGRPYYVMEPLIGRTLREELDRSRPLALAPAMAILTQVCDALQAAHGAGVIHRDLRPENVFLCERPGQGVLVKLLDFGVAELVGGPGGGGLRGRTSGTLFYMSPEQCRGAPVDARADVYALGVLMYEVFTGRLPFTGATPEEILRQHLEVRPRPPQELVPLPLLLGETILHALAKEPAHRIHGVAEVRRRLEACAQALAGGAAPSVLAEGARVVRSAAPVGVPVLGEGGEIHFADAYAFLEHYEQCLRFHGLEVRGSRSGFALRQRVPLLLHVPGAGAPIRVEAEVVFREGDRIGFELLRDPTAEQRLAAAAVAAAAAYVPAPDAAAGTVHDRGGVEAFETRLSRHFDFDDLSVALPDRPPGPRPPQAASMLDLLRSLRAERATGTLQVRAEERAKSVYFREGDPAAVLSQPPRDEERLGHLLVRSGRVATRDLESAAAEARRRGRRVGGVLVDRGLLTAAELGSLLGLQVLVRLLDLFRWPNPLVRWTPGLDEALEAEAHPLPLDDVLRRQADAFLKDRTAGENLLFLGDRIGQVALLEPGALDRHVRDAGERQALAAALDGHRTLGEAVGACSLGRVATLRRVALLLAAGALEFVSVRPVQPGPGQR